MAVVAEQAAKALPALTGPAAGRIRSGRFDQLVAKSPMIACEGVVRDVPADHFAKAAFAEQDEMGDAL